MIATAPGTPVAVDFAAVREMLARRKSTAPRCVRVIDREARLVRITEGKDVAHYFLSCPPADFGFCVRFDKWDTEQAQVIESHDANIGEGTRENPPTCDCKGFLHHGHCRHLSCALTLLEEKRI